MIEVRCFESLEEAAILRDEINELNRRSARPDPFSTFEYFENRLELPLIVPFGENPLAPGFAHGNGSRRVLNESGKSLYQICDRCGVARICVARCDEHGFPFGYSGDDESEPAREIVEGLIRSAFHGAEIEIRRTHGHQGKAHILFAADGHQFVARGKSSDDVQAFGNPEFRGACA